MVSQQANHRLLFVIVGLSLIVRIDGNNLNPAYVEERLRSGASSRSGNTGYYSSEGHYNAAPRFATSFRHRTVGKRSGSDGCAWDELRCADGSGCYGLADRCDATRHCRDASDESGCPFMSLL